MWKLVSSLRTLGQKNQSHLARAILIGSRYFLSEAFKCKTVWEKRLEASVRQNVNLDELFHKLDHNFNHYGRASVVDIDVFANAVRNKSCANEVEDLIYKLRLSVNATKPLPSTHHAFIRYFLETEQYETLLKILTDRLVYGVFPDSYCLCLILDTFIKKQQIAEAARVSSVQVLNEDWSNPLVTALALYSCHMYVQNPVPWENADVGKTSKEEVKAQVEYIRYPYFDDSSEIRDPQLLVGKTLTNIGAMMSDDVGQTYQLVGLGLCGKWEEAKSLLEQVLNAVGKPRIFRAGVKIFEETFATKLNDDDGPDSKLQENLRKLVKELDNQKLFKDNDLHAVIVSKVEQTVKTEEENAIKAQEALYREWENTREQLLKEEMEAQKELENFSVIQQGKQQFVLEEQDFFFFENEENSDWLPQKQELLKKQTEDT